MQSATVSIDEVFQVQAPPDAAWKLLTDPAVVVRCMPGAEILEERADGTLLGTLKVRLGPTVVAFRGEVTPTFDHPMYQGSLAAQGADGQGRTRARATTGFSVAPGQCSGAQVSLTGKIEVAGPLAPFVRTGGAHLTRRMVADFSANLAAQLETAAASADDPPTDGNVAPRPVPAAAPVNGFRLLAATVLDLLRSGIRRLGALIRRPAPRKDHP